MKEERKREGAEYMIGTTRNLQTDDNDDARRFLEFLSNPVVELRIDRNLNAGWFDDLEALLEEVESRGPYADQVYVTLQRLKPEVMLVQARSRSTQAGDVEAFTNLLLDFDAKVPVPGICSNDEEHNAALAAAVGVVDWLKGRGWPDPALIDTGNGAQLLYKIERLPADVQTERLLKQMFKFIGDAVGWKLDSKVANRSRCVGLPGTWNRKGESRVDRPHRMRKIVSIPDISVTVTRAQLESLIPPSLARSDEFHLERWFETFGIEYTEREIEIGTAHDVECPNKDEHTVDSSSSSTSVLRQDDGTISFVCQHDHCADWKWTDYRASYDKAYADRKERGESLRVGVVEARPTIPRLKLGEKIERPNYLIDSLLGAKAIAFWAGKRGSSKTLVARICAIRLAQHGIPVFYAAEDTNDELDQSFLGRLLKAMIRDLSPDLFWEERLAPNLHWAPRHGANLSDPKYVRDFKRAVRDHGSKVVFLDTFTRIYGGQMAAKEIQNWNAASAFAALVTELQADTGAAFVTLIHPPDHDIYALPGGSSGGLAGVADQHVIFKGQYNGGPRSDFTIVSHKRGRYEGFEYRGTVLGAEDGVSPLRVEIYPVNGSRELILPNGELLIPNQNGGIEWQSGSSSQVQGDGRSSSSRPLALAPR